MKARSLKFLLLATFLISSVFLKAQDSSAKEKADLKQVASTPAVQEELDTPDGVSIELLPDGGWRVFGKGTGTYDLNDADEIRQATKDAELRGKAAISKFMSEKIKSAESVTNISKKTKRLSSGVGEKSDPSVEVTKTDVQVRLEELSSRSEAILGGVITLETKKIPKGNGGTVSVVLGVSTKSLALAARVGQAMKEGGTRDTGKSGSMGGASGGENKTEVKKAKTDF